MMIYHINKLLLKNYEKEINNKQYKLLKQTWRDFLNIKAHNNEKPLFEVELNKIKYFNGKAIKFIFKCFNHQKKVFDEQEKKDEQIKELVELKMKINKILEQEN